MEQTVREQLYQLAEEKYRIFSSSLLPGKENILGVRIPLLRKIAQKIAKEDWRAYLVSAENDYLEEVMIQGMVIGSAKADIEELLQYAAKFVPLIDCWSICDSFCSGLKFTNKNKERVWEFLQPYLLSDKEYEIRFGVVMLLSYCVTPEYVSLAFAHFDRIKHTGYYVMMAVAWAVSVYYIKFPEQTYGYLKNNTLDDITFNKALQKITESYRIEDKTKEMIRGMKRKR